jgi:acyl carrier protein
MTDAADRLELLEQFGAFLSEHRGLDPALITEDAKLDDVGLDSLALADISFELFTSRGIMLDDGIILDARTVGDVIDVLAEHPGERPID